MSKYYPVNLDLKGKKCVVVGSGLVAQRKVKTLLKSRADVCVVGLKVTPHLRTLAGKRRIKLKIRQVNLPDINSAFLVISATDNRRINHLISRFCHKNNILVNIVDSPRECNFILPSVVRRGNLSIAISTSGISPALSKKIRQDLEKRFGLEYAKFLAQVEHLRPQVIKKIKTPRSRKAFFNRIIRSDIVALFKKNKIRQARKKLKQMLNNG